MGKIVKAVAFAGLIIATGGAAAAAAFAAGNVALGSALITLTNALALSTFIGGVVKQFTPRSRTAGSPGTQVEYEGTIEPRRIIYGRMRTSGMHCIEPLTHGPENKYLHDVIALAGHQVSAITNVYLGNVDIPAASIGSVTGTVNDGLVTTGDFGNVVWIRRYLGTATQAADYILRTARPAEWTTAHQGKGVAYLALQYAWDPEKYRAGKPNVEALVEGKLCYDPRLDSTNGGSGTHRYTDPTTWAWTQNPALCLADYLMDAALGTGVNPATRIDWPTVITAANICDENVALPGSTTQKRYSCNVVLEATTDFADNIAILARAMLGHCHRSGGRWRMYAGAWTASQFTLTQDHFAGSIEIPTEIKRRDKYNAVRSIVLDASQNYRQVEAPAALDATYETADGIGRRFTEVAMPACTNLYEAQRNCIIFNRQGRNRRTISADFDFRAFKIRPNETGVITLAEANWVNQTVRCLAWTMQPNGAIRLVLREAYSTEWTDPATTDYGSPSSVTNVTPTKFTPSAPQNLTATQIVDGILFAWDLPEVVIPGTTYSIYEHTAASPFSSAVAIATGLTGTSKTIPKSDTTTRYYWVVPRGPSGGIGAQTPSGDGIPGRALSITTGFRATASPGSRTKVGSTASLTSLSVTVTPINGTAPYTYAWTELAGGTGAITVTSPTAATTTFSVSGMGDPESRNRTKRCTVTDNLGATATVDVPVGFTRDSSLYL